MFRTFLGVVLFYSCTFLANVDGAEQKRLPFREKMARNLHDIERVDLIAKECQKVCKKALLTKSESAQFKNWLYRNRFYIGSPFFNHWLVYKSIPKLKAKKKFKARYRHFVENITSDDIVLKMKSSKAVRNISILYTGCYGGGHKSPATALANYFESEGYKIQLIDVDQVADRYSPRISGFTRAQIYQEVYQKEGNVKKAHDLSRQIDEAQALEDKRYLADLKQMLREFQPDHIFAVAHHRPCLSYLSYQLAVPLTFVHTDFRFNRRLIPIIKVQQKLKYKPVTFNTLTSEQSLLDELYSGLKVKKGALSSSVKEQLVPLAFPVRPSFVPASRAEIRSLRRELGVSPKAIMCKVAMGQNGLASDIKEILSKFTKEAKNIDHTIDIFVICGKNETLLHELQESIESTGSVKFHILGFLPEKEMARIDRASDVWITKPGGSTTAELISTQKQMLYVLNENHPWELGNAKYLKKLKVGDKLSLKRPILDQVKKRLAISRKLDRNELPTCSWQKDASLIIAK